jgi:ankyrin repeat protein
MNQTRFNHLVSAAKKAFEAFLIYNETQDDLNPEHQAFVETEELTDFNCVQHYSQENSAFSDYRKQFKLMFFYAIGPAYREALHEAKKVIAILRTDKNPRIVFEETFLKRANRDFGTSFIYTGDDAKRFDGLDHFQWAWYDRGTYNNIFRNISDGSWVLRVPLSPLELMSHPERAFSNWIQINPNYHAFKGNYGVIIPFLGDETPQSTLVVQELVDIYRRTRIIIADAWIKGNFRLHQGKAICVDIDLALRRGDSISDDYMRHVILGARFDAWCRRAYDNKDVIMSTVCALIYLEQHLSADEIQDAYITPEILAKIHVFAVEKRPMSVFTMEALVGLSNIAHQVGTLDVTIKNKPLFEIIESGSLAEIQVLISHNKTLLNQRDPDGYTPLHLSALYGEHEIMHYLISEGADLNIRTPKAMGNYAYISYPDMTALDILFELRQPDSMSLLLMKMGAEISPAVNGRYQAIHVAARHGLLSLVTKLVECDLNLVYIKDDCNQTALLWAASRGYQCIVAFLIGKGADVNICTQFPDGESYVNNRKSPLDWAIQGGYTDTILILKKAGAISNILGRAELDMSHVSTLSVFKINSSGHGEIHDDITDEHRVDSACERGPDKARLGLN